MKMTFLAFAGKAGGLGARSYIRSWTDGGLAAKAASICRMELSAMAPNPTAASSSTALRVRCLFVTDFLPYPLIRLITIEEGIGSKHRLDEEAKAILRI
jgi:hypothetical protein